MYNNCTHFRIAMGDKEGHSELPSGSGHTESKTMKITKPIQIAITVEGNEVSTPDTKKGSDDDFKKELEKAGLDPSHWSGVLKDKLRVTSSHALEHIGDDALSEIPEAKDWEKEALRKLVKKKRGPSPQKSVETELKKAGLDPNHWSKVLKDELGVTTLDELDHIGDESYSKLAKKTRHDWEKNALRKLFKMETKETKSERVEKRQAEAAQMLKDLKTLQNEGKERNDKVVQDMERGVREKLNVSDEDWISKDTTLDETIRKLEARHDEISGTLKARTDISEKAVVQSASSGRALEGVLCTNDPDDLDIHRHAVLKVPEDISLDGPSDAHHDIIKQFEEKTKEGTYTKRIDKHGYSVSGSVKGGYGGVGVEVGAGYSHSTESEKAKGHQEEETYSSIIKYSILPLASCSFKDYQLQLSDDAVAHLQRLEKASGSIQQECEDFLRKFGSHVYSGPLHFGGRYRWKSYTSGFKKEDKSTVQKLQSEAITVTVGVSFANVAGASVSTSVSSLKGKFEGKYEEDLLTQTFVEVKITGGPPEVTGLPDWKTGMVASNSTWCLIDRGVQKKPIWDIIEMNHAKDFKNPSLLAKHIKSTWEKIILNSQQREVAEELKHVTLWSQNPDPTHFEDQLTLLVKKKDMIIRDYMSPRAWPTDYLSHPPLQQYLKLVVECCFKARPCKSRQSDRLKQYLRQLVSPVDLDITRVFPNQEVIRKWLYYREEPLSPVECFDFDSLHACFKRALESMESEQGSTEDIILPNAVLSHSATAKLAGNVSCLRQYFQKSEQLYEEMFLLTILFPFKYIPETQILSVLISACDIEYLCKNLEGMITTFTEIKEENSTPRLQFHLISLAVKLYDDFNVCKESVVCHIEYLEKRIGANLCPKIALCLAELQSRCYDWEWFKSQPEQSVDATITTESGGELEAILAHRKKAQKIFSRHPEGKREIDEAKEKIFLKLSLKEYYPQKLTRYHAIKITEGKQSQATVEFSESSKHMRASSESMQTNCTDAEPNPFSILQNVIAFHSNNKDGGQEFGPEGDETAVHPMDSLLALLHCSDNFLRQDLMCRLATCQLAVPLLLPDPITREPTFLLWAMRTIVKEFRIERKSYSSGPIVDYSAPFVTFLRIGHHSKSKSYLINAVINGPGQASFPSGLDGRERVLVNGLVEVSWYLPSEYNSLFPDVITFANLHGCVCEFSTSTAQQVEFLSKVSCMTVVFLKEADLDKRAIKVLQNLSKASGALIILQTEPSSSKNSLKYTMDKSDIQGRYEVLDFESHIDSILRDKIQNKISKQGRTLDECSNVAKQCGIPIDEDEPECAKGRQLADRVFAIINNFKKSNPALNPKDLLALQHDFWRKWVEKDREQYRQNYYFEGQVSMFEYVTLQKKQMDLIRKEQFASCQSLNCLMKSFLNVLLNHPGQTAWYYLNWLHHIFDNMSREILPPLIHRYQQTKTELKGMQYHDDKDETEEHICREKLDELNTKMKSTSFGLEHLLREMGQIYEAVISQSKDSRPQSDLEREISRLPEVAAQLLVDGFPLELMDGEAMHLPIQWLSAVLERVAKNLKNPQMFVLSVLGLQSMGKSTMLNTLFGVQFSVGAGRCTRGAFMQLLPVHESFQKKCGFQYLLVIDTEGLRAPELDARKRQKYDNELATLILGVSNLTIINTTGEITENMKDILQIAVHALLRMKGLKLRPTCLFAHQDLKISADGELPQTVTNPLLTDSLNRMTQDAARAEGLEGDYRYFSQVIDFDEECGVYCFPSAFIDTLYNPEYFTEIQLFMSHLIHSLKRDHDCSVSHFKQNLEDIWKRVLQENAVFNFRDTVEIATYKTLEDHYGKWSRNFQKVMVEWERKVHSTLISCSTDTISTVCTEVIESLAQLVSEVQQDLFYQVKSVTFEQSSQQDVITKWRYDTRVRHRSLYNRIHARIKCLCKQFLFQFHIMTTELWHGDIIDRVEYLALRLAKENERISYLEILGDHFDINWNLLVTELTCGFESVNIMNARSDIKKGITDFLSPYHKLVIQRHFDEATGKSLERRGVCNVLVKPIHLKMRGSVRKGCDVEDILPVAQEETNGILEEIKRYLEMKQQSGDDYNPNFTAELLLILSDLIANVATDCFSFTAEYEVDMTLTVCGYALGIFEEMAKRFNQTFNPFVFKKADMKTHFIRVYNQMYEVKEPAELLCDQLAQQIGKQVLCALNTAIVDGMKKCYPWLKDKKTLKGYFFLGIFKMVPVPPQTFEVTGSALDLVKNSMMKTLFEKVSDPIHWLYKWIKRYTEGYCDSGTPSHLLALATEVICEIITQFKVAVQSVSQSFVSMTKEFCIGDWLTEFFRALNAKAKLQIKPICMFDDKKTQCFENVTLFADEIIRRLTELQTKWIDDYKHKKASDFAFQHQKPYDDLFNELCGCTALCPFCKEQCDNPEKAHDSKHTTMHRPIFFGDPKGNGNKAVILDTCPLLVTGSGAKSSFYVEGEEKWHEYKEYSKVYPKWYIPEDKSDDVAMYWKWLAAYCKEEIKVVFGVELKKVPHEWKDLSWEVEKWLKDEYNVKQKKQILS